MSKICLIGDNHFGCHNNSDVYLESQLNFYNNQFIPYLKQNNIKDIFNIILIHLYIGAKLARLYLKMSKEEYCFRYSLFHSLCA